MSIFTIESTAWAQAAEAAAKPQPSMFETLLPFLFIIVAMYFIMIRPQARKAKEHAALMKNLKVGDEVITTGGIIGRIKSVADDFVTLEAGNTHLKVLREHIIRQSKAPAAKA